MANFFQNFISSIGANHNRNLQRARSNSSSPQPTQSSTQYGPPTPSANAGATNPATSPITPPKTQLPPSGQQYAQSLNQTQSSGSQTPIQAPQQTNPQNAYLKYLTGMFDEGNVNNARKAQEDSMKRLADIQNKREQQSLGARRELEEIQDRSGGTLAGAQQAGQMAGRRSDRQAADIALQESAAARSAQVAQSTYDQYINAGKSVYEAELAANEAAQKSAQQTFENNLAMQKFNSSGGGSGGSVSDQYRTQSMQNINNYVDEALRQVKFGTAGFGSGVLSGVSGTGAKNLKSTLTTIKANIGFEALQAMREASKTGGALGQVAVQELEALQAVLGSIDQQQSVDQLKRNLTNIRTHYQNAMAALNGGAGGSGGGVTTAPDGTEIEIID